MTWREKIIHFAFCIQLHVRNELQLPVSNKRVGKLILYISNLEQCIGVLVEHYVLKHFNRSTLDVQNFTTEMAHALNDLNDFNVLAKWTSNLKIVELNTTAWNFFPFLIIGRKTLISNIVNFVWFATNLIGQNVDELLKVCSMFVFSNLNDNETDILANGEAAKKQYMYKSKTRKLRYAFESRLCGVNTERGKKPTFILVKVLHYFINSGKSNLSTSMLVPER